MILANIFSAGLFIMRHCGLLTLLVLSFSSGVFGQVDFRTPQREYVSSGSGTIILERQLLTDAPVVADQAAARLQEKITLALSILPQHARPLLEKIPFYVMYGPAARGGGQGSGLEYFQRIAPDYRAQLDPNWRSCVVIYSAANYVQLSDFWALKAVVHELAHAWQLEQWPEQHPEILSAWQNSVQLSLHHHVRNDFGTILDASYASGNQLEYFAELSCMYFAGCDYQPFNRAELQSYDPVGYQMIERMWQPGLSQPATAAEGGRSFVDQPSMAKGLPATELGARQWLDTDGNLILSAQFKSYHKGLVTVVTVDNSEATLALNVFSRQDQEYVLKSIGVL